MLSVPIWLLFLVPVFDLTRNKPERVFFSGELLSSLAVWVDFLSYNGQETKKPLECPRHIVINIP